MTDTLHTSGPPEPEPVGVFSGLDIRADDRIPDHIMVIGPTATIERILGPIRAPGPGGDRARWLADARAVLADAAAHYPANTFAVVEITDPDQPL